MPLLEQLKAKLIIYKDFPKKNVDFVDITTIFTDPELLDQTINLFVDFLKPHDIHVICGLEARGFLFGPLISQRLKCKFIPIRKKGKLPGSCIQQNYSLEYGQDCIEIQAESLKAGDKVVIIDDILATGGTMEAAIELVSKTGSKIVRAMTLIEIDACKGRNNISVPFHSFLHY